MFYCQKDAKENSWPFFAVSYGPCEICGTVTDCADIPSSNLPPSSKALEKEDSFSTQISKKTKKAKKRKS